MSLESLFSPEMLVFLEVSAIGVLFLFLIINKDFSYGLYAWLLSSLLFKYNKADMADSIMPDLSINRVIFAFLAVMFIIEVMTKKRGFFPPTAIEYLMFLFCLYVVISMMCTDTIIKEGGRLRIGEFLTGYMMPFFMFFISQNVYDTHRKREGFIKFIILIGLYLSLTAIFEHFNMKSFVFPRYILDPDFGVNFGRARGPFAMSAANGIALGFVFFACVYFLFDVQKRGLWKLYSCILSILTPIAILFTYTRSCWISFFSGLIALMLFFRECRKQIIVMTVIILFVAAIISIFFILDKDILLARVTQKSSVSDRLMLYPVYVDMFKEHPFFGVGFCKFSVYLADYFKRPTNMLMPFSSYLDQLGIHDTFGGILAEMGLVGIALLLPIYILMLLRSIKLYKYLAINEKEGSAMVPIFFAFFTAYMVNSIFIDMRYFEFINCLFFVFGGIICGWEKERYAKNIL